MQLMAVGVQPILADLAVGLHSLAGPERYGSTYFALALAVGPVPLRPPVRWGSLPRRTLSGG